MLIPKIYTLRELNFNCAFAHIIRLHKKYSPLNYFLPLIPIMLRISEIQSDVDKHGPEMMRLSVGDWSEVPAK